MDLVHINARAHNNAVRILSAVVINGHNWTYYGCDEDVSLVQSTLDSQGRGTEGTIKAVGDIRRAYGCIIKGWQG